MRNMVITALLLCVVGLTAKAESEVVVVEKNVKLSSSSLEVDLSSVRPAILGYRSTGTDRSNLQGASDLRGPEVLFYDQKRKVERSSFDDSKDIKVSYSLKSDTGNAIYDCHIDYDGKPAADYQIMLSLYNDRLTITTRLLRETLPVRVLSIKLPVTTVMADEPGAKMAFPLRSGRLVDVKEANPGRFVHKVDWFNPAPMAMVYNRTMLALVSLSSLDDQMISQVGGSPKNGSISIEFVRRPHADKPELSFQVQQDSTCTITILTNHGKPIDWTAGALEYGKSIPRQVNAMYAGAVIYKIMLDEPNAPTWTTLDDALDIIKHINRLTGGARQIVYLVGWQHNGHDTGYPDTAVFNERVGSVERFKKLIQEAKQLNAIVSVHDNYHDAYAKSPSWDDNIIARNSDGELAKGGIWNGGQAFIISPTAYLQKAQERARKTISMLGIEKTIHLDVLTDDPDRIDYNPASPAGRQKNVSAKLALISTFNQQGVDVTSEILTSPFVGRMSHFWLVENRPFTYYSAEESIPLVPMIFHGKVTAGGGNHSGEDMLNLLLHGWTFSADFSSTTKDQEILDDYYLVTLPWSSLATLEISGYDKNGSVERVNYAKGTYVEIDRSKGSYTVVKDGVTIAANYSTNVTMPDGTIMFYSRDGGKFKIDVPASWTDRTKLKVLQLVQSDTSNYSFVNGKLTVNAAPRVPFKISYGQK